jgi:hypothetical protein
MTICVVLAVALISTSPIAAQCPGEVKSYQKISLLHGGFVGPLDDLDTFGGAVALLGDLNDDGVQDLAVAAGLDDDGGAGDCLLADPDDCDLGAIWILFLLPNGWVGSHQKISASAGGFTGTLDEVDKFGYSLASVGDLDGDGLSDLAVGSIGDDDGGTDRGAVWILFLNADGTVKSHQKISSTAGDFFGPLDNSDLFGSSIASLGDLDGDGLPELAVGAFRDADTGFNRGALWILFLDVDASDPGNPLVTVKAEQKINELLGEFLGSLDNGDLFGCSVASLGDLDNDGQPDLAVGAYGDDDGASAAGAVWILFLDVDTTGVDPAISVKSHQKLSSTEGGLVEPLEQSDLFGLAVTAPGDLDDDGVIDLAVGALRDDDGGLDQGAVWVLFLNGDGTVKAHRKISETEGGTPPILDVNDHFSNSLGLLEDFDEDGIVDLAVGATLDDDGGGSQTANRGSMWLLFLNAPVEIGVAHDMLWWGPRGEALSYDVIRGDLSALRDTAGDFSQAMVECLAGGHLDPFFSYSVPPDPGEGFWFLSRRRTLTGGLSYDTCGTAQAGPRDAGIAASGADCP